MNLAIYDEVCRFVKKAYFVDNQDISSIAKRLQLELDKVEKIVQQIKEENGNNVFDK